MNGNSQKRVRHHTLQFRVLEEEVALFGQLVLLERRRSMTDLFVVWLHEHAQARRLEPTPEQALGLEPKPKEVA